MDEEFAPLGRNAIEPHDLPALQAAGAEIENEVDNILMNVEEQRSAILDEQSGSGAESQSSASGSSADLCNRRRWTRLPSFQVNKETHEVPCPRRGHSCTTLSHAQMLLFGGVGKNPDGAGNKLFNDTYLYVFDAFPRWKKLTPEGASPPACAFHTASLIGDCVWFLTTHKIRPVFYLNLSTVTWHYPELESRGFISQGQQAFVHQAKIYLLGGATKRDWDRQGVVVLDTVKMKMEVVPMKIHSQVPSLRASGEFGPGVGPSFPAHSQELKGADEVRTDQSAARATAENVTKRAVTEKGTQPMRRYFFGLTPLNESMALVVGGRDDENVFNDVWIFNARLSEFIRCAPMPLSDFSGIDNINSNSANSTINSSASTIPSPSPAFPKPRAGHTLLQCEVDGDRHRVLLLGGWDGSRDQLGVDTGAENDLWLLTLDLPSRTYFWTFLGDNEIEGRDCFTFNSLNGLGIIFGGCDEDYVPLNDLQVVDFDGLVGARSLVALSIESLLQYMRERLSYAPTDPTFDYIIGELPKELISSFQKILLLQAFGSCDDMANPINSNEKKITADDFRKQMHLLELFSTQVNRRELTG